MEPTDGHDAVAYLAERAAIFYGYLDANELYQIIPERKKAWQDLEARIKSGSKRKLKALNDFIDNVLIGENSLAVEDRYNILLQFEERLQESRDELINKKRQLAFKVIDRGFLKSNVEFGDILEIRNSEILGLTEEEKARLTAIMQLPVINGRL